MKTGISWSLIEKFNKTTSGWLDEQRGPRGPVDSSLFGFKNTITVTSATQIAMTAFGDSITAGSSADVGRDYPTLLSGRLGLTLTNVAGSGRGVWLMAQQANLDTVLGNDSVRIITSMTGLNDIRRGANSRTTRDSFNYRTDDKCLNKILASYRNLLIMKFRTSVVAAGSSSVTRTGTHSVFNGASVGGKYNGASIPSNTATFITAAGTWSYTFTGDNIAVGMFGADGVNVSWGTFSISIDGNVVYIGDHNGWWDGVSDGTNNNQRGPVPFWFGGLRNTSHTVVVTQLSGTVVCDYFAVLGSPSTRNGAIIAEIPYIRDYSKSGLDRASREYSDLASKQIYRVFNEFKKYDYPVAYLRVNDYYDTDGYADPSDGVHPLNRGHYAIARAFLTCVEKFTTDQKFFQ
jgi:lysophospholipase L1-like esterase